MPEIRKTMSATGWDWASQMGGLCSGRGSAGSGTRLRVPGCPESVQNQLILQRQPLRAQDNFIGVLDKTISGDAPGFVTNDTIAVFTRRSRTVSVAVKECGIDKHWNLAATRSGPPS